MGLSFTHHYSFRLSDEKEAKMVYDHFHKVGESIKGDCTHFDISYLDNRFDISSGGYGFLQSTVVAQVASLISRNGFVVAEAIYSCQGDVEVDSFQIGTYYGPTEVSKEEQIHMFDHSWWPTNYELQLHSESGEDWGGNEYEASIEVDSKFGWNDLDFLPIECRSDAFGELVKTVMNQFELWGGHYYEPTEEWDTDKQIREEVAA